MKNAVERAAEDGGFAAGEELDPGPGFLVWDEVDEYRRIDSQNGRLRWLIDDLERLRAFELLWIPPSLRYYDTGSVYESPETASFTKRSDGEMDPYWVFHRGPAKVERHVPVMPFSRDAAALPQLRKSLAACRLAFGQPRQQELVEFLGADRSDADLRGLVSQLRIDLSPP